MCKQNLFLFGCTTTNSRCHQPCYILQMAVNVTYNISDSTVNGSGIGPDSTVLGNISRHTNQRTPEQTMVAQACHESNPNEVPIPQIIVQTGDTENLATVSFVTELSFNRQSPLARDLHALATLLLREYERLFHIAFFLFNVFQH